ncbi:MAG: sulfatase-like hydrolase/transferase [Lachnospiraceae bacterium]|nr:sulfatase-like hydrolase/transferase [Lachnospiraceae bacterium]
MEKRKTLVKITYGIAFVVMLVLMEWDILRRQEISPAGIAVLHGFYVLTLALWFFGTKLLARLPEQVKKALAVLTMVLYPLFLFLALELPANADFLRRVAPYRLALGFAICILLALVFVLVLPDIYVGMYAGLIAATSFGIANGIVIQFRTYPIAPADLVSIGTAHSVAGGYSVSPTWRMVASALVVFFSISIYGALRKNDVSLPLHKRPPYPLRLVAGIAVALLSFLWIKKTDFVKTYALSDYDWDPRLTYEENGFALSFLAELHKVIIDRPEGYSKTKTAKDLNAYSGKTKPLSIPAENFKNQNPVVITVMNESFTDWDLISDFPDSKQVLDYYTSLQEDPGTVEYGSLYVSTRGGGTCKSEYEYLTGYSMQFLPSTIPYMMYSFSGVETLVGSYHDDGYTTIAMHPFFPTDWKRNTVYGDMGFDDYIYAGDYDLAYRDVREYETDEGDYRRMLEEIEEHPEPVFIFNITLQNHGGYDMETFSDIAVDIAPPYEEYEDLSVFEGMMAESDDALEYLMQELKKLDRPVIISFFGDHQPALSTAFDDEILENGSRTAENDIELAQRLYAVPYFIWTNYAVTDKSHITSRKGADIMSANYLGVMTRYYAGGRLSPFENFLLGLRKDLPVINSNGYWDGNAWYTVEEKTDLVSRTLGQVKQYARMEYMLMFDHAGLKD